MMIKSFSSPNIMNHNYNNNSLNIPYIKKSKSSTSLNAIVIDTLDIDNDNIQIPHMEYVLFSNSPVSKILSCSIENNKFPDNFLEFHDKDYVTCITTPPEPLEEKKEIRLFPNKSYFQESMQNINKQEEIVKWITRIRRKKKKK